MNIEQGISNVEVEIYFVIHYSLFNIRYWGSLFYIRYFFTRLVGEPK